ncbi:glycerate kinase [Paenibacillus beijingensis]|uniref:Glycerate kinase n=1 Tax=Paenibacillus beijingensis TaxID=1126833 RepID=A0A0D5NNM9_9BACL|nr:glycerate kinase [Paenibacillus beijingensis]AJY76919.1 glycerate kinase [Paenibacillus beijingensis]
MNIIVAPDSFKGSLSSIEAGRIIEKAFALEWKEARVAVIPVADGGEGTVDALLYATGGERVELNAKGPECREIPSFYGILGDRNTAVIEVAAAVGLQLVPETDRNPLQFTSYGVGELMLHALDKGYREFIIGLGGSATNDGGLGMLQALGAGFSDGEGNAVLPTAASLSDIRSVDFTGLDPRIRHSRLHVACDVDNPLCGESGASAVFGPQKGASPRQVEQLDSGLSVFAACVEKHLGQSFQHNLGAGAAGGLGFALLTIGARMESGASLIARAAGIEEKLLAADWLITGEGYTDEQSLRGKLPYYLSRLAKSNGVPTILLSGAINIELEVLFDHFDSMHAIASGPLSLEMSISNAERLLYHKARNIARLLRGFVTNKGSG